MIILLILEIGGGIAGFCGMIYGMSFMMEYRKLDKQDKAYTGVNWRYVGEMEKDIYGTVLSPQAKIFFPEPKPTYEPLFMTAAVVTHSTYKETPKPNPNTFYSCKGHAHRYSDNKMVNPFTGEVAADQWCSGNVYCNDCQSVNCTYHEPGCSRECQYYKYHQEHHAACCDEGRRRANVSTS